MKIDFKKYLTFDARETMRWKGSQIVLTITIPTSEKPEFCINVDKSLVLLETNYEFKLNELREELFYVLDRIDMNKLNSLFINLGKDKNEFPLTFQNFESLPTLINLYDYNEFLEFSPILPNIIDTDIITYDVEEKLPMYTGIFESNDMFKSIHKHHKLKLIQYIATKQGCFNKFKDELEKIILEY